MKPRTTILTGVMFSFLAVVIGAFAAHALKLDGRDQIIFETGVRYQFYHSMALLVVGILALQKPEWVHRYIPIFFTAGIVIFSGSLYILVLTDLRWLGAITPIGGVSFLIGWVLWFIRLYEHEE